MLYIIAVVFGIAAGILAGGKMSNIFDIQFKKTWIIIFAFVIQIGAQALHSRGVEFIAENILIITGLAHCILLIVFWFNRYYLGILVIGAGSILNGVVMMLNGGRMPVSYDILKAANLNEAIDALNKGVDIRHTMIDQTTRMTFLADVIHPPGFLNFYMKVVSIGDLVVILGLSLLIFEAVYGKKKKAAKYKVTGDGGIDIEKTN